MNNSLSKLSLKYKPLLTSKSAATFRSDSPWSITLFAASW